MSGAIFSTLRTMIFLALDFFLTFTLAPTPSAGDLPSELNQLDLLRSAIDIVDDLPCVGQKRLLQDSETALMLTISGLAKQWCLLLCHSTLWLKLQPHSPK